MRIISGQLKKKKLFSVAGTGTRPTTDRVRESIFNILGGGFEGAVVLDLFAGTGALGIEALSRGAKQAVFIDGDRQAVRVIHRNIEACGLEKRARVIRWDIARNLRTIRAHEPPFELVFMDPPYGRDLVEKTLAHLAEGGSLAEGARVVVEHTPEEEIPEGLDGFTLVDRRKYGRTLVTFLSYSQ